MGIKILKRFLIIYLPVLLFTFLWSKFQYDHLIEVFSVVEDRTIKNKKDLLENLFQTVSFSIEHWGDVINANYIAELSTDSIAGNHYFKIIDELRDFDQFRIVDLSGNELLRYERDQLGNLKKGKLQNKYHRDYFKQGILLKRDEIYLSRINLNRENGEIEIPLKPVMRGISPIYDHQDNLKALVIINFNMTRIFNQLNQQITLSNLYLVDQNLNVITTNVSSVPLSYELQDTSQIIRVADKTATYFKTFEDTTFQNEGAIWTLSKFNFPTNKSLDSIVSKTSKTIVTPTQWAILHEVPAEAVDLVVGPIFRFFIIFNCFGALAIFVIAYIVEKRKVNERLMLNAIKQKNENLRISEASLEEFNQKLTESNSRLKTRNKQLEEFNYLVSHNLRAPVSSMSTVVDLLKEVQTTNELDLLLPKLSQINDNISIITDDIREYVSILSENEIDKKNINIKAIIESVENDFPELLSNNLNFKVLTNLQSWDHVIFSKFYFKSIVQSFMSNSIKYRRTDIASFIKFETQIENGQKVLYVIDNGLGIDLDLHGKDVFKLYKRFHRGYSGKGMGLFIVKSQIENLEATIEIESAVNKGTTFKIIFKE